MSEVSRGEKVKIEKGCEVMMGAESGCVGYGNIQCVKEVCEPLGTVALYGHNQHYNIHDIRKVVSYPAKEST